MKILKDLIKGKRLIKRIEKIELDKYWLSYNDTGEYGYGKLRNDQELETGMETLETFATKKELLQRMKELNFDDWKTNFEKNQKQ